MLHINPPRSRELDFERELGRVSRGDGAMTRNPRNRCHHHAGQQLHRGHITAVESVRCRGKDLKHTQGATEMTERGCENGAHTQMPAAGHVNVRISLRIVAHNNLSGASTLGGDAGIGLQAYAQIGRSSPGPWSAGIARPFSIT